MSERHFQKGEIILVYGTYRCAAEGCTHDFLGVPGRRFPSPTCQAVGWVLKNRPNEFRF